jgi:hypothetical protein
MTKKILLWVEDNPSKKHRQLIQMTTENRGLDLEQVEGVSTLHNTLINLTKQKDIVIQGIILDLMIYGADSLQDFGYPTVTWEDASDVGKYLLTYVFRNSTPEQQALAILELLNKPVLILTVKSETRIDDFKIFGNSIELVHKYSLDDADSDKSIRDWINKI